MTQQDLRYWLALCRTPHLGAISAHRLLAKLDSIEAIFSANAATLKQCGVSADAAAALRQPDWSGVDRDLAWQARSAQHHIVTYIDSLYPPLLKQANHSPILLFVAGNASLLSQPQLAMVGSRNPSPLGREVAHDFAAHLAQAGLIITSGLASGIDSASHQGALYAAQPTVAVLGTGIDRVYPQNNSALAEKITAHGALVSEFPTGTAPAKQHFPQRNRVISSLSLGTFVVEAALQSGSLITARCAAEQGREVFAMPGSIHNPVARGCHYLLRQGAKLVETAQDIVEELGPLARLHQPPPTTTTSCQPHQGLDPDHIKLLECVGYEPTSVDSLVARSQFSTREVASMLLILELQGAINSVAGGYCRAKGLT